MNTRKKGIKNENKVKAILERDGFLVQRAPNPTRFSKQNDLFGLWDIIAVSSLVVRFIQVKTNKKPGKAYIDKLRSFPSPPGTTKELWVMRDRKEHKTFIL